MIVLSFLRFCRGYVTFTAKGRFPERLLNLAAGRGINLWNPQPVAGGITGAMSVSDYKRVRPLARRSKCVLRIEKKRGVPFFLRRCRGRAGIPVGAVLGALLIVFLSQFIWSLRIVGADNLSETKVRECLAENGISVGIYKGDIDVDKIERDTLMQLDDIRWLSVNLLGCTADIEVSEKAKKPDIMSLQPCNIKAREDGVITSVKARGGFAEVKEGSGVVKGDLLVSGVKMSKLDTPQFVHADAEVMADIYSERELKIPCRSSYISILENKTERSRLKLFHREFPVSLSFFGCENAAYSEREQTLCLDDTLLPLSVRTETEYALAESTVSLNAEQAQEIFRNAELLYEVFERPAGAVKQRRLTVSEEDGAYVCHFSCVFNENIAEPVEFSVTEG